MTTTALEIVKIGFDTMESTSIAAKSCTSMGIFMPEDAIPYKITAVKKVIDWFAALPPQHLYYGWDGNVYPKYEVIEREIN